MKIISKFDDYYDHVTGYYFDTDRIWQRTTEEKNIKVGDQPYKSHYSNKVEDLLSRAFACKPEIFVKYSDIRRSFYNRVEDSTFILGLCGKLYICITFHVSHKSRFNDIMEHKATYINLEKYLEQRKKYNSKGTISTRSSVVVPFTHQGFAQWYQTFHEHPDLNDIFIELNTPIFIIKCVNSNDKGNLILNPCLKDYKLQSAFNPFTTYQDIDMFLGNQLAVAENTDLNRSQELIRDSKGFDEWSFKQRGPKKRKRKK